MKLIITTSLLVLLSNNNGVNGFTSSHRVMNKNKKSLATTTTTTTTGYQSMQLSSSNKEKEGESQTLGLLTFDLDDTLYPIGPVEDEANRAFVGSMLRYGFQGLEPNDIVNAAKQIRAEREQIRSTSVVGSNAAPILTHVEVRELAIRREMETIIAGRKLDALADDEATSVGDLNQLLKNNAKRWAKAAVSESMVKAVSNAWEMERHHAAERNLYPEVIDVLKQIKADHPTAIIGAVVDGRSNPLFMTFTLAPLFDFSCSWEDDQGGRLKYFQELENTGGEVSQLTWLYDDARYKYAELKKAADGLKRIMETTTATTANNNNNDCDDDNNNSVDVVEPLTYPEKYDDRVWIHVGDDLAYDVGGSAACGAKTIYAKLDTEKYQQTARTRYEDDSESPSWSTTPSKEIQKRIQMSENAKEKVDKELNYLTQLPEAINDIVNGNL